MRKLKLTLDDINVIGFEVVTRTAEGEGTVHGADALTRLTYCNQDSCLGTCNVDCV